MNDTRLSLAAAGLIVLLSAANAQNFDDTFQRDLVGTAFQSLGGYYTTSASQYLREQVATDFTVAGAAGGLSPAQTGSLVSAIRSGQLNIVSGGSSGFIVTPDRTAIPGGSPQANFILSFFSPLKLGIYLQRLSTIKLQVEPVPPRDYQVVINGEPCGATDDGIYRVSPGNVAMSVTRAAIAPCIWRGPLTEGQIQDVTCKLEPK